MFYVEDKGARGLCVEELGGAKILDGSLSVNFKIHFFANMDGLIFLWDYFDDLNHLSKLMDFDPETVADFEKARASFSV
ncbi:hypothetical protein JL39_19095 [Rhizobium sp. YS-1r]|nr:hypothetical protein JL39_19095 [Rhizobium sp. YS-1r]